MGILDWFKRGGRTGSTEEPGKTDFTEGPRLGPSHPDDVVAPPTFVTDVGKASVAGDYLVSGIRSDHFAKKRMDDGKVYEVWMGESRSAALTFLRGIPCEKIPGLYYIIVETPDGNFGKDINGMFDEDTGEDIF